MGREGEVGGTFLGRTHDRVRHSRRCVGVSWKTTILDLRMEKVKWLLSYEVWAVLIRDYMEEGV